SLTQSSGSTSLSRTPSRDGSTAPIAKERRPSDRVLGQPGTTGVGSGSPRTPASRFAAAIAAILPRVAPDADAMWGTIRQLSRPTSGSSIGIGSGSVTSSAAAQIVPSLSAAANAAWSTTGPRDVLISTAVGFIQASVSALMRWRVTGLRLTWSDTKSL